MVRNEADIVEAFVRHNLTVLDGMAIVDHGSIDATLSILTSLVQSCDAGAGCRISALMKLGMTPARCT